MALMLGGCDRQSAELQALRDENGRLKKALEQARGGTTTTGEATPRPEKADLNLTIAELWAQRFEDQPFRAKQRLDQKQIRVTGMVENVSDRGLTMFGTGTRFGPVSLLVQLDESYIKQNVDGLSALAKGVSVTVQGRFLIDKMWLEDARFVDRTSGKPLAPKELLELSEPVANTSEPVAADATVKASEP